ncbi:hypothetical protein EKG37_02070 [Robertmurraya yapensis]|uniref:DegT/DnrJ/EryC1/StrS aminotransferase family protein n=1 Tax=Bacillus yapensis TaxID=2492960 RepID=A0A3S0J253_9BACI|nr:hypothetical protein [Bacillus yapensis]RTR36366.1 hypothetical protein EKG37_02070 [Bacillus yapensis]TKT05870.1 hypothetical protein FAR12_02070 [Bacillus yapensis]
MRDEIGGFFELELLNGQEYHSNAIKLNKARSALYYFIKANKVSKIYLPYYMCECILEPILSLGIEYEMYRIDREMQPIFNGELYSDHYLLYINYFGLNTNNVYKLVTKYKNIIIDNTQAFFDFPIKDIPTIYSPRKFFGVPDGAYLYHSNQLEENINTSVSFDKVNFLTKRIDVSAEKSYELFQENERILTSEGLSEMSRLTKRLLSSIDYDRAREARNINFLYLHKKIGKYNQLKIDTSALNGPMVYPFLFPGENIKEVLIKNKIYIPTYWKEILQVTDENWYENYLSRKLVSIPIDQRYGIQDMNRILNVLNSLI